MAHDIFCEMSLGMLGCDCARRAYVKDPWVDDDGRLIPLPPKLSFNDWGDRT